MTKTDTLLKKARLFEKVAVSSVLKIAAPTKRQATFQYFADVAKRTIIGVLPEFTSADFTTPQSAINSINTVLNEYYTVFDEKQLKTIHNAKTGILGMMSKLQRAKDYSLFTDLAKRTVISVFPEYTSVDTSTPQKAINFIDMILNKHYDDFVEVGDSIEKLNYAKRNLKDFL